MLMLQGIAWDEQQPQIWSNAGVYDNVRKMCDGYAQSPQARDRADFYRSINAAAAWRTNHFDDARKLLDALGEHLDTDGFKRVRVIPSLAVSHVYAMTGPVRSAVEAAEKLV